MNRSVLLTALLISCSDSTGALDTTDTSTPDGQLVDASPHPSCDEDTGIIVETPSKYNAYLNKGFNRYTEIEVPNGTIIRIFAQDNISAAQIVRSRNLMKFYLSNAPGTTWGDDKTEVSNSMGSNNAILLLINGYDGQGPEVNLPGQYLFEDETPVEGDSWYMNNNFNHRDAAFEEIFHLVHDAGIGTYLPGALPDYQEDLLTEAEAALDDGRWGIAVDPGVNQWIKELRQEGSLAQEYIASVIDSYYGLWGPWDEAAGGMWGIYIAKTREEMASRDPKGQALLEQFLTPYISYEVRLDPTLNQDFDLNFHEDKPYTHKSRYLVNVTLTGAESVGLIGNDQDNTLRGNSGDNHLNGSAGNDTVIYCSPAEEYTVTQDGDVQTVTGPDGVDTLTNIEHIHFTNGLLTTTP